MRNPVTVALLILFFAAPAPAGDWDVVIDVPAEKIYDIDMEGSTIWMSTKENGLIGLSGGLLVRFLADDCIENPNIPSCIWSDSYLFALLVDHEGDKWVGRDNRRPVDRLDDGGTFSNRFDDTWTDYKQGEHLVSRRVFSIAQEDTACGEKMWFGIIDQGDTEGSTVELFVETPDSSKWYAFDYAASSDSASFSDDYVTALAVDRSCRLWIGYPGSGVDVWDYGDPRTFADDSWEHYTDSDGLPSSQIMAFRVGPDGRVWTGTTGGLAVFDPAAGTWQAVTGLPGIQARAIDIDAQGHVWVGTENGIAMLYSNGRVARIHGVSDGIAHEGIVDLVVDQSNGTVWAVSEELPDGPTALNVFESGFGPPSGEIFAYPNPWKAGESTGMIGVFGATEGSRVEIFDLTGERIRELPRTEPYVWDALDSSSNKVPSGLYLVRIEKTDGTVSFTKVAIVR